MRALPRRTLWTALAIAGIAGLFGAHVVHLWTITEDAFISFRYARHLVEGHGLVWNPGEPPVEGYTNFLWVAALAGALALGLPIEPTAQFLGVACALATLLLVLRSQLHGGHGAVNLAAALLLATSGPFANWASSGMETSLFCLLAFLLWRARAREGLGAGWGSSVALLLAALTRPEGALLAAVTFAQELAERLVRRRPALDRAFLTRALVFALPFAAYFLWRWHYFGQLLPNTFYAKVGTTAAQVGRGAHYLLSFVAVAPVALLALAAPAFASFAGRLAALLTLAYCGYVVLVGGDYMTLFRFLVPVVPLLVLLEAGGLARLGGAFAWGSWARGIALALAAALQALPALDLESQRQRLPLPDAYWELRETSWPRVALERWHVARLTTLGLWLQLNLPKDAVLAYDGIGAIGYYSQRRIIDMSGLNDRHIAHSQPRRMGAGAAGHEKSDLAYVLERRPEYVLLTRHFARRRRELASDVAQVFRPRTAGLPEPARQRVFEALRDYELMHAWIDDPLTGERGFVSFLRRRDAPELP